MNQAASFQRELEDIIACPELPRVTALLNVALVDVERGSLGLAEAEDVAAKHGLSDVLVSCGLGVVRNPVRFLLLACREEREEQQWSSRVLANLYFALTGSELARTRIGQVRLFLGPKLSVEAAPVEAAPPPPHVHRPYRPYHPVTREDLIRAAEYVRGQH